MSVANWMNLFANLVDSPLSNTGGLDFLGLHRRMAGSWVGRDAYTHAIVLPCRGSVDPHPHPGAGRKSYRDAPRPRGVDGGHSGPSAGAEGGRRAALARAAVHGGRRGGVRGGERRPQPRPPGRRLRPRHGRVPARPRGARHARRLPLPRPRRLPLPWSRVREPVPQVRGAGVRRRRGGRAGAGAPNQGHRRKAHRQVRHQVLHGR